MFGSATSGAVTNGWYVYVSMNPSVPMCECGKNAATETVKFVDGRPEKRICRLCIPRIARENAIHHAKSWLEQAFLAVMPEQRSRLYRQLAVAFHPDAGGDAALMVALNAVRERYP